VKEQRSDIWPHAGWAALALSILALAYALYLWFFASSAEFYGWVSTLFSTLLSVFFALVVGLALFEHQGDQPQTQAGIDGSSKDRIAGGRRLNNTTPTR
jgi:high-affinity Fe2+/Pb2+ permease